MKAKASEARGFDVRLGEALRSPGFRKACIQRLVAASIDATDGLRVMELAIAEVREETRVAANLTGRLLRAVHERCAQHADMRGHPYADVVGPLIKGWDSLMSFALQKGLTEEEGYAVMRDLLRKVPASRWAREQDVGRALAGELRYGFLIVGATKGCGKRPAGSAA